MRVEGAGRRVEMTAGSRGKLTSGSFGRKYAQCQQLVTGLAQMSGRGS
jgi:hypothetical protein